MIVSDIRHRQTEAAECGLACLSMSASMLGAKTDLVTLRQEYPLSARGSSLRELTDVARSMGLSSRAVRCEPADLAKLNRPSILHWRLNHFVVLDRVNARRVRIFDPARGFRDVTTDEISENFTGVALELSVTPTFQRRQAVSPLKLSSLFRWTPEIGSTFAQTLILSAIMQAYVIASPLYMQIAIDDSASRGDTDLLLSLTIAFLLLAVFNSVAELLRGIAAQRISSLVTWDMTRRLYHHMIRLPLPWFQRRRLADALSRFQALDPIKNLIATGFISALIDGALSVTTLIFMFIFSPTLALISIAGMIIYIIVRLIGLPYTRRLSASALQASIVEQGKRIETLRAIQTIKVMGAEGERESDWANKLADTVSTTQRSAIANISFSTVQRLFDAVTLIFVIFIGIKRVISGNLTVGKLDAFVAYRGQFIARASSLFEQLVNWKLLDIYTFRLADVVLNPTEPDIDRIPVGLPPMRGDLEFQRVAFRYSPSDPMIVRDASFKISAGEFVGITGPSGAGKSTLLKLICGLFPSSIGSVRIDGLPISTWGPRGVRDHLGAVMQDDELLPGSIADNVSFFSEEPDRDWIWRCLRLAAFDEEVRAMPMRIDTFVGDMGSALSGGQRQRVLIARALYKRPKLLIFDEATSQLDLKSEAAISEALSTMGVTRIVVAHRPETLAAADRLLVLENGIVREAR